MSFRDRVAETVLALVGRVLSQAVARRPVAVGARALRAWCVTLVDRPGNTVGETACDWQPAIRLRLRAPAPPSPALPRAGAAGGPVPGSFRRRSCRCPRSRTDGRRTSHWPPSP